MAERLMAERGSCCSLGELIHNEDVVERLKAQGLRVIQSPEEAQRGEQVLIRAHGVAREVYERLAERGAAVTDASCPKVKAIHAIVSRAAGEGRFVIIIGMRAIPRWRASAAGAAAMPCLKMHASFPHGWTQIVTTGQNL